MIKRAPVLIVPVFCGLLLFGIFVSTAAAADVTYNGYTYQNQNLSLDFGGITPFCTISATYQARVLSNSFPVGAGVVLSFNVYASGDSHLGITGTTNSSSIITAVAYLESNCSGSLFVRSGDDAQLLYQETYGLQPTPIATAIFTNTGELTSFVEIPPPWPLPEITHTLNFAPLWDIESINRAISIIQTFFLFDNVAKFFKIFVPFSGFVIALKWLIGGATERRKYLHQLEDQDLPREQVSSRYQTRFGSSTYDRTIGRFFR